MHNDDIGWRKYLEPMSLGKSMIDTSGILCKHLVSLLRYNTDSNYVTMCQWNGTSMFKNVFKVRLDTTLFGLIKMVPLHSRVK